MPEPVLSLADLDGWRERFTGTALAVLGWPVDHSISPPMHNAALAAMAERDGRFGTWRYFRFAVPPEQLAEALTRLHAAGFLGLNLTVPHKVLAFDLIAEVSTAARYIGAVNTLRSTTAGWRGHNTDGYGLATAVRETLGHGLAGADVVLLGAGGAARGAAVECIQQGCRSLWIANRTISRRDELLRHLAPTFGDLVSPMMPLPSVKGFDPSAPPADLPTGALMINATSAGLKATDPLPIDLGALPRPAGVYDMIYNPPETRLLAQARALGLPAANGLSMLVHQGVRALEIWSDASVPAEVMREAAAGALASRH